MSKPIVGPGDVPETRKGQCKYVYTLPSRDGSIQPGDRCPRASTRATDMCRRHNDQERRRAKAILERGASVRLREFTELEPADSPLLDPFSLLVWETRRTLARIKWYDTQLMELKDERALWWGKVKEERVNATEFAGTNKTYEARQHELLNMQDRERKRLQDIFTFWTNAKLEAARIATVGVFKTETNKIIRAILSEFAIDTSDPAIRDRVANVLTERAEHLAEAIEPPDLEREG